MGMSNMAGLHVMGQSGAIVPGVVAHYVSQSKRIMPADDRLLYLAPGHKRMNKVKSPYFNSAP